MGGYRVSPSRLHNLRAPSPVLTRRELGTAILLCGLGAAVFLWPALLGNNRLSPADLLFSFYPWHPQQPPGLSRASNGLLIDSVVAFEPWLGYTAARLHAGALPLWNPDNMLGAPFIGNMQSAVFYPFNWPAFVWPGGGALVLRAWFKLFTAALGAYLLARQVLRVGPLAASVAAICFAFGAFMTVWLLYPLTNAAVLLPWLWLATALLVAAPSRRGVAALAMLVAFSLFAGHPETAYHIGLATGAFMLFSVLSRPAPSPEKARAVVAWAAAYGLGALIAAVQLLPFGEYLSVSSALAGRSNANWEGFWLPLHFAWTMFSPDLFGNPAHADWWAPGITYNYNEVNSYIGVLPLLLVPLAFFGRDRAGRHVAIFLALLALLAAGVVYHAPIIYGAFTSLPFLRTAANHRLLLLVEFALGLLAALGVQHLISSPPRLRIVLLPTAGLALLGIGVPLAAAGPIFALPAALSAAVGVWEAGLWRGGLLLLVGGGLLAAICLAASRPRTARTGAYLLPVLLLADLWGAHADYNPTVAAADYFPPTGVTRFLAAQPGLSRSTDLLLPNTNLAYGLPILTGYDAVEPRLYGELVSYIDPMIPQNRRRHFNANDPLQSRIWNLLNVGFVAAGPGSDPNYLADIRQETGTGQTVGDIRGASQPGQTFTATHDNLAAVEVLGATQGGRATGRLVFHLKAGPAAPADLVTRTLEVAELPDDAYWPIRFPPILRTKGRSLYFYFTADGDPPGPAATLWYSAADAYPGGTRTDGGRPVSGDLEFRTASVFDPDGPWLVRAFDGGATGASVFENRKALPRAWIVHAAAAEADPKAGIASLYDPAFDWTRTALLDAPLPAADPLPSAPPPAASDTVSITRYEPEHVEITADSPEAGLLILSDQAFPGWEAAVDGRPAPIITVDHALRGVYLGVGRHRVEFDYRPASFAWGAGLTGLGLLVALGLVAWPRPRREGGSRADG
ncbi:MAG: hypothetical protein ACR2M0_14705 [Chloroflexia bacterium]